MEVIFAAWIDSDIAILAFNFFAEKVRINGQLLGHHRSSLRYRAGLAGYGLKYSHLKRLCQEPSLSKQRSLIGQERFSFTYVERHPFLCGGFVSF
jgi:hypothetical protein